MESYFIPNKDILRFACYSDSHGTPIPDGDEDVLLFCGDWQEKQNIGGKINWFKDLSYHFIFAIQGNCDNCDYLNDDPNAPLGFSGSYITGLNFKKKQLVYVNGISIKFFPYYYSRKDVFGSKSDILVSHLPPSEIYPSKFKSDFALKEFYQQGFLVGVFGHIHEQGGEKVDYGTGKLINCAKTKVCFSINVITKEVYHEC